jgi:hypothetical protein
LWLAEQFGDKINRRLILTHRKDLVKGDILIDDRPNNGAKDFEGELIKFGSDEYPNWAAVIDYDERFYILSENEYIELVNRPKPQRNNAKFTYYTLSEVLSKKIISPESAYNSNILK